MSLLLDPIWYSFGEQIPVLDADGNPKQTFRTDGGKEFQGGLWSVEGVPHSGWYNVGMIDALAWRTDADGKPLLPLGYQICEMCKAHEVRYIHIMQHDDYDGPPGWRPADDVVDHGTVRTGRYCAGYMENDRAAAVTREDEFKAEIARKGKLERKLVRLERGALAADWFPRGNYYLEGRWHYDDDGDIVQDEVDSEGADDLVLELGGYRMAVRGLDGGRWRAACRHKASGHGGKSPRVYATEREAQRAAIKAMLMMTRKAPKTSWGNIRKRKRGSHYR